MTSNKNNIIFEKTSFLQGNNSIFIKELYSKYLENPKSIPQSWVDFFDGLDEDQDIIKREILGPSWAPKKKIVVEKKLEQNKEASTNGSINSEESYEKDKEHSVKAIALIRAYRIRGCLLYTSPSPRD